MDIKYDEYLNAGTKRLMEFLSSNDVDQEERKVIVSAFTDELERSIGDVQQLPDYDNLIYSVSIKYVDEKISEILAKKDASYGDYVKALALCERERGMLGMFSSRSWKTPQLSNNAIDQIEKTISKRQESTSITTKIQEEDRTIDELIETAQKDLSVKACDDALNLIETLSADIAFCKQKRISVPAINNKDTRKSAKLLTKVKKTAVQKEKLHQKIYESDLKIHTLVSLPKTSPEQWTEIINQCQIQMDLLSQCRKNQWPIPSVRYAVPDEIAGRYKHYQNMHVLDKAISSERGMLSGRKQYKAFFGNCSQQQNNIETCQENGWPLPDLDVPDPASLAAEVQDEKSQKDKAKKIKQKLVLAGVAAIAVFACVIFGVYKYREGKVQVPFGSSYAQGQNLDFIYSELENAGFEKIEKKADTSGWLDGGSVIDVSIDNQDTYKKGSYVKPDVSIVVTYSSSDRIYVTDLLKNWKETEYGAVVQALKNAGINNINTKEIDTSDQKKDGLTASLALNGEAYTNENCYIPKNAPVTISYYALKIGIGNNSDEFIGQDHETVVTDLQKSGFTNVQAEKITTGWAKGNTVVGVTVNNADTYDSSQTFAPDVKIVVKYSSGDRTDATVLLENWSSKQYTSLQTSFKSKGFKNVTVKKKETEEKSLNQLVASVSINGDEFKSGDCFVQNSADIVIEYYNLKITVGESTDDLTKNTEGNYSQVAAMLESKGFTNVKLYRKNDLINGWITKEGSIASISIGGNDSFSETDSFDYDSPVVIIVHTFKNKGCDDITDVAN